MASKYAQEKGISAEDGSWQKNIKQGVLDKLAEYEIQIKTLEGELVRERETTRRQGIREMRTKLQNVRIK
jgi:hypothetical protein